MNALLTISSLILYIFAAVLLALRLFAPALVTAPTAKRTALIAAIVALALHASALYSALYAPEGLNVGFFNMLSLTTWFIAAVVVVSAFGNPVENLGIALLPLAAFGLAMQELFPSAHSHITPTDPGLDIHILLSIASYSLLAIAAVQSLLLALQDHQLRNRKPGGFVRALPPLETMERLLFRMIGVGYILLSLALISGVHFLNNIFAQHMVHKTILSIAAWIVFAILLWGRWRFGWRGRIAIRWTLSGYAILMLAYFGSKLVKELILHH